MLEFAYFKNFSIVVILVKLRWTIQITNNGAKDPHQIVNWLEIDEVGGGFGKCK